jgi:hypothetical protein
MIILYEYLLFANRYRYAPVTYNLVVACTMFAEMESGEKREIPINNTLREIVNNIPGALLRRPGGRTERN